MDMLLSIIPFCPPLLGMSHACHDLPSGNTFRACHFGCQENLLVCPSAFRTTSADSCLTESSDLADFFMYQKLEPLMCEALES